MALRKGVIHMAKNSNIMTEMMQKYGVSSGSYGGSTERTASPSDYFKERMDSVFGSEETRKSSVDSSFIDSFVKDSNDFFTRAKTDFESDDTQFWDVRYAARQNTANNLRKRSFQIQQYLDENRDSMDKTEYDRIKTTLDDFGRRTAQSMFSLYRKNRQLGRREYSASDYETDQQDSGREETDSLEQEIRDLEAIIDGTDYDWTDVNQRNKASQAVDRLQNFQDRYTQSRYQEMLDTLSEKDRKALEDTNGRDNTMAYGYLLQKGYSRDDINAMYETMKREKTAEVSDKALETVYDKTGKNVGTASAGFAGARAGNQVGAVTGTFQAVHDTAKHYLQGSQYNGTDPNALGYLPSRMAVAADQAVSDAIEGENGGILRKGAAFVYRGAANAADNLARMAVSSAIGGPALGEGVNSAFSFTQGFQSTYREAQEKGGSPLQGLLVGSVDGGMEVFTESKTFERWMNLKDPELIGEGVYEWLKSAAIGIGNEITEEEASYIANTIADAVVMADKSESAEYIKAAVAEGKTPAQARWELVKKYAHEMAVTAADTAMSTILMEGATGAVANYQYNKTYGGSSADLVQEGLESPEGTKSRDLAEQYQKKLDEGKSLSGAELQRLVNANEAQFAQETETQTDDETDSVPGLNVADSEMETTTEEPEKSVTLESLSEKYGPYAEAMRRNHLEGQNAEEYDSVEFPHAP